MGAVLIPELLSSRYVDTLDISTSSLASFEFSANLYALLIFALSFAALFLNAKSTAVPVWTALCWSGSLVPVSSIKASMFCNICSFCSTYLALKSPPNSVFAVSLSNPNQSALPLQN